ncbi:Uncharacterised protein [Vibrio cholerae]|nr:Uncharacterised protein [Vibrio cholerae]CSI81728.1 Uncharacterised protein [Vibrio cholerae]
MAVVNVVCTNSWTKIRMKSTTPMWRVAGSIATPALVKITPIVLAQVKSV